jgi:hypothetical protein
MTPPIPRITKGIFVDKDYTTATVVPLTNFYNIPGQNSGFTVFGVATTGGVLRIRWVFDGAPTGFKTKTLTAGNLVAVNIPHAVPKVNLTFNPAAAPGNIKIEVVNY